MKFFTKPTPNESVFGLIYFILQLMVIPGIIIVINMMMPTPISETLFNFLLFAINFAAVLVIFHRFLLDNFQLIKEVPWHVLRWAGIGALIYMAGNIVFSFVTTCLAPDFTNINDAAITEMAQDNFALMSIGTVLLVPIAEECFYRGLIFRNLYDRSPALAYIVSMVLFSLAHVLGYVTLMDFGTLVISFFQYLPAGFALAFAYRKSGSIYASILIHMSVNQMGMLMMR